MSTRKLFADEIEARLDALLMLRLRQRSATLASAALESLPRETQERVMHWVAVAAQQSTELGLVLANTAADNGAVLDDWALAGLEAFDLGGLEAAAATWRDFACLNESRRWQHGVSLTTMHERLSRLLHALSGRHVSIAAGLMPLTDTETCWLPAQLDVLADAEANARLYQVMAVVLWAQARFGTYDRDPSTALAKCADSAPALQWLALCEAMRLEACIARELPAMGHQMATLRSPWLADLAGIANDLADPAASVVDSLHHAIALAASSTILPPALPYAFALDFARVQALREIGRIHEARGVAPQLNVLRGAGGRGQANPEAPPLAAEGDAAVGDPQADLIALPPDERAPGDAPQEPGEVAPKGLSPAGAGVWQPVSGAATEALVTSAEAPDAYYDEWDYRRKAWRRNWCHLYEADAPAGDIAWVQQARQRHSHLIRSVRRRFENLRGEDRIHRRQMDGEDLDLDAQVEAHADRKSGVEPSPALFCHRRRSERSLAVMFMVDMSGSTKGWVNDAERESLVLLSEAIESLGDRYAIYGFSGWTRTRCDIYRIKEFAARYDEATQARIAGIEARDYTRMGVAVRHLSGLLAAQPARHKLLVTLSDGRPDDYGDEYRGHYGIEDTRRALHEARVKGIRSYCVTIDRHGADYLPQLYGQAHYTVIDDAKKLPQKLAEIYRKLTS